MCSVLLDEHLTWRYHITELSKKLATTCGILFKDRCLLPRSILIMLYNALFLSFYDRVLLSGVRHLLHT